MAGAASQSLRSLMSQMGMVPKGILESVRNKAILRIQEKMDPTRIRHKPVSLVRQEARQFAEQFLEAELPTLPKPERDQLVESVLSEAMGYGILEELFRDETIREFIVLAPMQVILRKGELWLPSNTHFRDADHLRNVLNRIYDQGESLVPNTPKTPNPTGFHVRLPNGFRVLAVVPPTILEMQPMVVFTREIITQTPAGKSNTVAQPGSRIVELKPAEPPSAPRPNAAQSPSKTIATPPPRTTPPSGVVEFNQLDRTNGSMGSSHSRRTVDPLERAKQRITEKIISRLATVGAYDLSRVPINELQRVIALYVSEFSMTEGLGLQPNDEQMLTREILQSIKRQ